MSQERPHNKRKPEEAGTQARNRPRLAAVPQDGPIHLRNELIISPSNIGSILDAVGEQQLSATKITIQKFEMPNQSSASLTTLLAKCPQLKELSLNSCSALSNIDALASCTKLEKLDLAFCTGLTDISALASCTELQELSLRMCHVLSNIEALEKCTKLKKLNLSYCMPLSDISALKSCTELEELDLSGCTQLSDISALVSCTALETLNLRMTKVLHTQYYDLAVANHSIKLITLPLTSDDKLSKITLNEIRYYEQCRANRQKAASGRGQRGFSM